MLSIHNTFHFEVHYADFNVIECVTETGSFANFQGQCRTHHYLIGSS